MTVKETKKVTQKLTHSFTGLLIGVDVTGSLKQVYLHKYTVTALLQITVTLQGPKLKLCGIFSCDVINTT